MASGNERCFIADVCDVCPWWTEEESANSGGGGGEGVMKEKNRKSRCSPENPGVRAAIFLARASLSRLFSSFKGRRWTLKIDALPLMSGGPVPHRESQNRSSDDVISVYNLTSDLCRSAGQSVPVSAALDPRCRVCWFPPEPPRWWLC